MIASTHVFMHYLFTAELIRSHSLTDVKDEKVMVQIWALGSWSHGQSGQWSLDEEVLFITLGELGFGNY